MKPKWIIMFYSMPSKPEKNRIRIWRRLQKEGTLSFSGAYLLPYSDEHFEFFQWLCEEIKMLDGEMSFAKINNIETASEDQLIERFNAQATTSYGEITQKIKTLQAMDDATIQAQETELNQTLKKIKKEFAGLKKIDFFESKKGVVTADLLQSFEFRIDSIFRPQTKLNIPISNFEDFQNKQWLTRPKPFVDRMACAWLIRTFIDSNATFIFSEEEFHSTSVISYDMSEAVFTHIGNLCTFEVLIHSFAIKDPALSYVAQIVHNLDLKDDRYATQESDGIFSILSGINLLEESDETILLRGADIFKNLYAYHKDNLSRSAKAPL